LGSSSDWHRRWLRLIDHEAWANREFLEALGAADAPPPECARLLAHVAVTGSAWLARIHGEEQRGTFWPEFDLDATAAAIEVQAEAWRALLASGGPEVLARDIEYTNSEGRVWRSSVESILDHVLQHAAYHRGQIALRLKAAGIESPYTDYVHAVRAGVVE